MNLNSTPDTLRNRARLRIWWILWAGILGGLCITYVLLGRGPAKAPLPAENPLTGLAGMVPLFVSIIIRWLALPRLSSLAGALPMFVLGLASAEACGLLGIFLGGVYKNDLVLLGVLGVMQYVPFFAKNYLEPKPQGFIPNN